ncbi:MAG: hypothetical protein GY732_19535, partial [Gammaproteobacteria bacterium]|nr:hypothetical protein [Gammaproteobacteria bacterium]
MPFKLLLQVLITLFVAAVIFAVATGQFPFPANQEPIVLQGGSRMASGISMDAETKMDEAQSDAVHLVVQFGHYLTPTDERTLERQYDVQILEAVPEFAYVLALPGDQARAILLQMMNGTPAVKAVVSIRDQDRLSPSLGTIANPLLPEHAVTTIEESDDYDWRLVPGAVVRPVISSSYPAMDTQVLRLIVHFFSDVIRDDQKEILGSVGATFSGDVKQPNAAHGQWWVNI